MSDQDSMDVVEEKTCGENCTCGTEKPTLEPADELEWLREQYVVLKQNNDSLRAAYSAVGQEASALRRAMTSRQPTVRERAAIAAMPMCIERALNLDEAGEFKDTEGLFAPDYAAMEAVLFADALVARLTNG